ncbi:MAG: M48 family metalloprotease [Burkholderiaceae bacterium]|nr:M48 family metalloprotease [Burkholderiaceae bacterium]
MAVNALVLSVSMVGMGSVVPSVAVAGPGLPTLGEGADLSVITERRLGDSIIRELYRDPDYLDDPVLQDYVQAQWLALLAAAQARGELPPELEEHFAWEVLLGRDRSINAFALPGGYLGVHLGLLGVVANRDELASVLAHELSHVTQRHIARLLTQQNRQTPLLLGTMVLAMLAASKNPQAAQALTVGGQALAVQNQLNFSRDMEREADRVGYSLMAPAGFAPQGFVGMFDKLQQANRLNDNGSWPYLRSHPLTTQRVADMQARLPLQAAREVLVPTLEHAMLAARARVLSRPGADMLRQWLAEPRSNGFAQRAPHQQVGAWYAAILAASQLHEPRQARQWLARLQVAVQGDTRAHTLAQWLGAEIELAVGDAAAAWQQLPALGREDRPGLLLRAQIALPLGRASEVVGPLQTWVSAHPRDASAWQALASACQAQGQTLRAIRAEAEAHAARYDYAAAIDRFKAGQEWARKSSSAQDFVEVSIIDTRLRAVQALAKEQAAAGLH